MLNRWLHRMGNRVLPYLRDPLTIHGQRISLPRATLRPWQTTLDQLVLDVRRDISCVVVSGLGAAESVSNDSMKAKVALVLSNFPNHLFVFLGEKQAAAGLYHAPAPRVPPLDAIAAGRQRLEVTHPVA